MQVTTYIQHPDIEGWSFQERHAQSIQRAQPAAEVTICSCQEDFVDALPLTEIALCWRFRQAWFKQAPRLRILATPAAGREYLPEPDTSPKNVRMVYGHFHGELIAETVLGMMLGVCRGLLPAATATDPWPRTTLAPLMHPLRGRHLLILGFGNIGKWVGRMAKPFGMRITGIQRHPGPVPDWMDAQDRILPVAALDAQLPKADFVVLALPQTVHTKHLLNRHRLRLLPERAVVVNVGRGHAIDEAALAEALCQRQLRAACLDVFTQEPLPMASPLRTAPHCYLTPHASAISPNYLDLFIQELVQDGIFAE